MFIEIKVRVTREEKWTDFRKLFDYMIQEYSKVKYDGKKIDPYPDRVNKFYDNIPEDLIEIFKKAYPNVDISVEKEKARAWLLSNTGKSRKDLKRFTNNWLSRAMENGGSIPVQMEHKIEKRIEEHKKYVQKETRDSADDEWRKNYISGIINDLAKKKKVNNE